MRADDENAVSEPQIDEDAIREWTAANERAREAYAGHMSNLAGLCAQCHDRRRDGRHRLCHVCRYAEKTKRKNR